LIHGVLRGGGREEDYTTSRSSAPPPGPRSERERRPRFERGSGAVAARGRCGQSLEENEEMIHGRVLVELLGECVLIQSKLQGCVCKIASPTFFSDRRGE
jgi:hypothetical protein